MQEKSKYLSIFLVVLFAILAINSSFTYAYTPRRSATRVHNVFSSYTADDWIVSPDEEGFDDQDVSNAPECDIKSVIACYDEEYLRIDITLYNPISYDMKVAYGVILGYKYVDEYYFYYPHSDEFIYCMSEDNEITEYESLSNNQYDYAGVTSNDNNKNTSVYIIINKDKHFDGKKGNSYYLTCNFYSGYIDLNDNFRIADETIEVELEYTL